MEQHFFPNVPKRNKFQPKNLNFKSTKFLGGRGEGILSMTYISFAFEVNNPQAEGERRGEGAGISTRDTVIRFERTFTVLEWRGEGQNFRDISLGCPFRGSLEGNQTYRAVFFNF